MIAMAKIVHHNYPNHKIVFLSPCYAKKEESKLVKFINSVITFKEMKEVINKELKTIPNKKLSFDKFYNEYTKIYPVGGGLAQTMKAKNIFKKSEIISCENCINLKELIEKNKNKKLFDLLFCKGGCIGGPAILSKESTLIKKNKIINYRDYSSQEVMGKKRGLDKYLKGINFERTF